MKISQTMEAIKGLQENRRTPMKKVDKLKIEVQDLIEQIRELIDKMPYNSQKISLINDLHRLESTLNGVEDIDFTAKKQ